VLSVTLSFTIVMSNLHSPRGDDMFSSRDIDDFYDHWTAINTLCLDDRCCLSFACNLQILFLFG